jgi:hypothetical protein
MTRDGYLENMTTTASHLKLNSLKMYSREGPSSSPHTQCTTYELHIHNVLHINYTYTMYSREGPSSYTRYYIYTTYTQCTHEKVHVVHMPGGVLHDVSLRVADSAIQTNLIQQPHTRAHVTTRVCSLAAFIT